MTEDNRFSRRQLLYGVAATAGGAAVLIGTAMPAEAKIPKQAAKYQTSPKGQQQCSNCSHFEPPSSCLLVAGKISPHGWCRFYAKK